MRALYAVCVHCLMSVHRLYPFGNNAVNRDRDGLTQYGNRPMCGFVPENIITYDSTYPISSRYRCSLHQLLKLPQTRRPTGYRTATAIQPSCTADVCDHLVVFAGYHPYVGLLSSLGPPEVLNLYPNGQISIGSAVFARLDFLTRYCDCPLSQKGL